MVDYPLSYHGAGLGRGLRFHRISSSQPLDATEDMEDPTFWPSATLLWRGVWRFLGWRSLRVQSFLRPNISGKSCPGLSILTFF